MAKIQIEMDDDLDRLIQNLMKLTENRYSVDELVEAGLRLLMDQEKPRERAGQDEA